MHVAAIIAAAGRGTRLGAGVPKPLVSLGGRTILQRSFETIHAHDRVDEIVISLPAEIAAVPPAFLLAGRKPVQLVSGGVRRQDSVANAFDRLSAHADIILVHDAARPLATPALFSRVIEAAGEAGAAVAALLVRDTVKEATGAQDRWPTVARTLARDRLFLAQTPQAFSRSVLAGAIAYGRQGGEGTDEAALAEQAGYAVRLVEGEPWNIKITTAEDLQLAQRLLKGPTGASRIGVGYDLHRVVEGRPLILGGVDIPHSAGLAGHSDADVLSHAVTDAVLGAACAGDIGQHFPDHDARWRGVSSIDLLRQAAARVRQAGYAIANVDAVVIAERPKLAPHLAEMRRRLAAAMGIDPGCVSIKGKTNEGIGELGAAQAIAVHAVALVRALNDER